MAVINTNRGSKIVPNSTDFNPKMSPTSIRRKDLNTIVYQQGVRVNVYSTLFCPNVKSIDGGEHNVMCPVCKGRNFIDLNPLETIAFIQGQDKEYSINPENIGTQMEEQTVMASFLSGIELNYYTKIELLDYTHIYNQLVQRQVTGQDIFSNITPVSYTASTGVLILPDSLDMNQIRLNDIFIDANSTRFVILSDISDTIGAKQVNIGKNKIVDLSIGAFIRRPNVDRLQFKAVSINHVVDADGIQYFPETDFSVDRNGDIEWLSRKPADKKIYSVFYNTLVAYRAIRAIHSNRYGTDMTKKDFAETVEYPQQWVLKKLFLFHREDSESGMRLDPNKNFPPGA